MEKEQGQTKAKQSQPVKTAGQTKINKSQPTEKPRQEESISSLPTELAGQTEINKSQPTEKPRQTEINKSQPSNQVGRPPRDTPEPEKWTIKGVDRDSRAIIQKVAARSGKPLGRWFNEDLRELLQNQLKKGSTDTTIAKPEELVLTLFDQLKSELKAEQSEELKAIRQAIENKPASFWEWMTGKKK
jgi:hypothetical protein